MFSSRHFLLLSFSLLLFFAGCKKEDEPSIEDIRITIDLVNAQGEATSTFTIGEDPIFRYTETNISGETVRYFSDPCPEFQFRLWSNGSLIGDPIPETQACTEEQELLSLPSNGTRSGQINWLNDTANTILPPGDYSIRFSNTIRYPDINKSRIYNLEVPFTVTLN